MNTRLLKTSCLCLLLQLLTPFTIIAFDQYEYMKVGETKTFYFPSEVTSRASSMYSYNCSSDHINNVEVVGYTNDTGLRGFEESRNYEALYRYNNSIKGTAMDNLISSLPKNTTSEVHHFRVLGEDLSNEGNVCTKTQVKAAKAKGWTPYYNNGSEWVEYEGSDDATSIKGVVAGSIEKDAAIYNLSGQRLDKSRKGINIIGGKKVMVK